MSEYLTIHAIEVTQPIGKFYICKINPNDLLSMSKVDLLKIEKGGEISGIQREQNKAKVAQIKKYLKLKNASFPNSIILNTSSDCINYNSTTLDLQIKKSETTFSILDGQHRLSGFSENEQINFELVVSIFVGLQEDQQANLFSTINSTQTKVDPSLNLKLELKNKYLTPKKMLINVALALNDGSTWGNKIGNLDDLDMVHNGNGVELMGEDIKDDIKNSPMQNSIKLSNQFSLNGGNKEIISLNAFVTPLFHLTFPDERYLDILYALEKIYENNNVIDHSKDVEELDKTMIDGQKYIFWGFYCANQPHVIYKILLNYFNALKITFKKDWLNEKSILNKTTGYNALMKLFKDLFDKGVKNKEMTQDFFVKELAPLSKLDGTINSSNYGASGTKETNKLYETFINILNK